MLACGAEDINSATVYVVCDCNVSIQPLKYFNSSLCLWDIKNNSKIIQNSSKGKWEVDGNAKICLPVVQRILIVLYM